MIRISLIYYTFNIPKLMHFTNLLFRYLILLLFAVSISAAHAQSFLWNKMSKFSDIGLVAQQMPSIGVGKEQNFSHLCQLHELRSFANQMGYDQLQLAHVFQLSDSLMLNHYLGQGREMNYVLMLEPEQPSAEFDTLVRWLDNHLTEYDLCCQDVLVRYGSRQPHNLVRVGTRDYGLIVLPPTLHNLTSECFQFLRKFVCYGGVISCIGDGPSMVDGVLNDRLINWIESDPRIRHQKKEQIQLACEDFHDLRTTISQTGELYHQRRIIPGGQLFIVVNFSATEAAKGQFYLDGVSVKLNVSPCSSSVIRLTGHKVEKLL